MSSQQYVDIVVEGMKKLPHLKKIEKLKQAKDMIYASNELTLRQKDWVWKQIARYI